MNNDSTKGSSSGNTSTPGSGQDKQGTRQLPDEEIGDYANPDEIQVDGGDNSFVANEDEKPGAAKKKT